MGLIDKGLVSFKAWTVYNVEKLSQASHPTRQTHVTATDALTAAKNTEAQATLLNNQLGKTPESKEALRVVKDTRALANNAQHTQKRIAMIDVVKCRLFSLSQSFGCALREHGIKKEHCHGGKCNGVNCIRIMTKSQDLFSAFAASMETNEMPGTDDTLINKKTNQHAKMLGLLDAIWSNVQGIDAGLLPTKAQVLYLRKALDEGKSLWNQLDLGTLQPKWHVTFDGHLVDQVIKHGGLHCATVAKGL